MARETQRSLRGEPWRGAAREAPTAPHATEPLSPPKILTGPARFWGATRVRVALVVAAILSLTAHWWAMPWRLWNVDAGIEVKDAEGELAIPVDLLGEEIAPPPEPDPTPPPRHDPTENGPNARDGGAKVSDAGGIGDAAAASDAGDHEAGIGDAGIADAGLVALADAGIAPGTAGAHNAAEAIGVKDVVNTGPQNVTLVMNVALIRSNPFGARLGPVFQQIPQWRDFMRGSQSGVDPIRDTDWILIYGPSLIHTDRDAVLIRYNISDQAVDAAVDGIASSYDKGGPYDAGVRGVKASLGYADNGQRVFLRPQSKLLVIVPPAHAAQAARAYATTMPRGPAPNEAVRLIVKTPSNQVSIRGLSLSKSLKELRLWIVPRADTGADVYAEGDCDDEASAAIIATELTNELARVNQLGFGPFNVSALTRGLLDKARVSPDGKRVKLHVEATPNQLEAVLQLVAGQVGAQLPPAP